MELAVKSSGSIVVVEIQKNGALVSAQNPVTPDELSEIEFPVIEGCGLIISGMPVWAVARVALHYKNTVRWIGTLDPRLQGAVVVHSMDSNAKVGQVVPLP